MAVEFLKSDQNSGWKIRCVCLVTYNMDKGYEVSKKGYWDGQSPNDIFLVFPIINIDDLIYAVLFGSRINYWRHQRFES